jgi:radical SAM protein with 4Fe4S-binding SPASM domain
MQKSHERRNPLRRLFHSPTIPAGRFTYRGKGKFAGLALQLRVEPNHHGLLVINANTVLYLNETATAHAYYFMQGMSIDDAVKKIRGMYRVNAQTARRDFQKLEFTVSTLTHTEKVCPISFLDVKSVEPFTQQLSAPLRMDFALTFKCQNDCVHCYTGGPHETEELTTEEWKRVIDRVHGVGVFIITFTGGEPTLREDLPELLQYAQKTGVVTGLVTNGRRLKDKEYVKTLEQAGLDFVQVTLESHKPQVHDSMTKARGSWKETVTGIKNAVASQIYVTTNTTLSNYNARDFLETIDFIKSLGVAGFGCNSLIYSGKASDIGREFIVPLDTLKQLLPKVHEKANHLGLKFMWYTPTQYCQFNPVALGLGVKSCTAAMVNMCIGPDGNVYPCQSYFEALGNILKDDWQKIWNNPLAVNIRNRTYAEPKCKDCPELQVCGGGCPLELQNKNHVCAQTQ